MPTSMAMTESPPLPSVTAVRYVVPLKEGGSLPAIIDTVDSSGNPAGLFVVKFRGAGQGAKALIAEVIVGLLARELGLLVPEIVAVELDQAFGKSEKDPEIQDILRGSRGTNIGLRYLEGSFNFDAATATDADLASRLVWLDAFTFQIDRTARNPNLLLFTAEAVAVEAPPVDSTKGAEAPVRPRVWLIDHGAALYPHHDWSGFTVERARDRFPMIKDHVLLANASQLEKFDDDLAKRALAALPAITGAIPDDLLLDALSDFGELDDPERVRAVYREFLENRLASPRAFVTTAVSAREALAQQEASSADLPRRGPRSR